MEQILLNEVEAFEKRKKLALRAVEDYVRTVIDKVQPRCTYNIQNRFEEVRCPLVKRIAVRPRWFQIADMLSYVGIPSFFLLPDALIRDFID